MGYIRHNCIIVTGDNIIEMHKFAIEIFGTTCSEIIESPINGYNSFFIAPDGSKEGWMDSDKGDKNRKKFIKALKKDGSCDFVELTYGGDDEGASVMEYNRFEEDDL